MSRGCLDAESELTSTCAEQRWNWKESARFGTGGPTGHGELSKPDNGAVRGGISTELPLNAALVVSTPARDSRTHTRSRSEFLTGP